MIDTVTTPLEQIIQVTRQYDTEKTALDACFRELETARKLLKQKEDKYYEAKRAVEESETRITLIAKKL